MNFRRLLATAVKLFCRFFNIFTIIFLALSVLCLYGAEKEKKEWAYLQKNGITVEATIVDIKYISSDEPHYAYFEYEVDGKTYIYEQQNYPDGLIMGKTITAYVYPDNPGNLIISDGSTSTFFVWFMLILAAVSGVSALWLFRERKNKTKD